ncbi:hypothetical protein P775_26435 [Puniceibacterium antarcticum]|uniref:DUF2127 domain-containing protein n=1 Tax=Puniceibacterium antarcticum TaxID=1206336 RepID=A0A2G8QZW9_9RHOB|nr:DUF2127 domain-containing protein [Puniceibacterium antarcticum]PIL14845.1 hypothetical protein P775_26435 [Puniceibacterium antarcticum]
MTAELQPLPRGPGAIASLYRLGLLSKASVGLLQFCAGLGLWLAPADSLVRLVSGISQARLLQSPLHFLMPALNTWALALPAQTNAFYALYLMGHGALSFGVITAIFLRLRHAYPVAMAVLLGLVLYQLAEYLHTRDTALLFLSGIDLIVISLISVERFFSPHSSH